ncbi:hypothetical protein [Pelagibacterium sp. H642]|uniref:hypothetical protein n=1 Tax=Pelagibacterium sp. H642 TaxID=1881069 RepID=UPI002814F6D1|nr:hypothetical protein [Pelagibacterium sp. H642]WMT92519.1 hypothetical protein NO934_01850 [Pelagibacterium sp. H642]
MHSRRAEAGHGDPGDDQGGKLVIVMVAMPVVIMVMMIVIVIVIMMVVIVPVMMVAVRLPWRVFDHG